MFTPLLLVPAIAACSSDSKAKPDAHIITVDAPPDTPPPPPGCDYGELRDDSNDDAASTGSPEDTMLMFGAGPTSPAGTTVLCGKFNNTHFQAPMTAGGLGTVDADAYTVTFAADTRVYVSLYGAGIETLGYADIEIYGGQGFSTTIKVGQFQANHAAVAVGLPAGTYEFYALAGNAASPGTESSYKIRISEDMPDTRCVQLTTGGYAEAHDNADNLGNDMIGLDDNAMDPTPFATFTTATTDAPEPTALTIAPAMSYRLSGSAVYANPKVGTYHDRDTYEFTTGATTNEITIRTKWTANADLDMVLFNKPAAGATDPDFYMSSRTDHVGAATEFLTTAVKPNTPYWIWVGNYDVTGGVTAAYDTTICGVAYTPPQ